MREGRRQALLLACTSYQDEKLRNLRAPEADVEQLTAVLGDPRVGNFEVEPPLLNGSKEQVEERIEGFFDGAGPSDLLLLYLSGHGIVSSRRQWFFATPNTKVQRPGATAVSDTFIRERMNGSRSPSIVLVLDCCHAGAFARSLLTKGDEKIHVEHHFEGRGRVALTASTEFEWALEDAGERPLSVFTQLLIDGLRTGDADLDGDGQISITELYNYVARWMPTRSPGQTPGKAGDLAGEIVIAAGRRGPALPDEIRRALVSSYPALRIAAIGLLVQLPRTDPEVANAVDDALSRLAMDDDPEVAATAQGARGARPAHIGEITLGLASAFVPAAHDAHWEQGKALERAGDLEAAETAYVQAVEHGRATAQSAVERVRRKRFDLDRAIAVHGPRAAKGDRSAKAKLRRAYEFAGVPEPVAAPRTGGTGWSAAARAHARSGDFEKAEEIYLGALQDGEPGAERALERFRKRRADLEAAQARWGRLAMRGDARALTKLENAYRAAGITQL